MSNCDSFHYFFILDIVPFTFLNVVYGKSLKVAWAMNKSESLDQLVWGAGRKPVTEKREDSSWRSKSFVSQ